MQASNAKLASYEPKISKLETKNPQASKEKLAI
jgi:hypothetical protein